MQLAVEAVLHYAKIPILAYFFSLPDIHDFLKTRNLSLGPDGLASAAYTLAVYKGTEGLLLDIYGGLGQGHFITDDLVKAHVASFFSDDSHRA